MGLFKGSPARVENELDPLARSALSDVLSKTRALDAADLPLVAPFDAAQVQGLQMLQDRPQSPFIGQASNLATRTLGGDFLGLDNPALAGVRDSIMSSVGDAVSDRFTAAGRTGSPAHASSMAKEMARALAPFEFQNLENERARQMQTFGLLPGLEGLQDAQASRLLGVGGMIQDQNQRVLQEPLMDFESIVNPLISATGSFPTSQTQSGGANPLKDILGLGIAAAGLFV